MPTASAFNYLICTAPRTGSTLLAQALSSTNVAGRPNEYFDIYPHNDKFWVERLGVASDADYLEKVLRAGKTANGVFGLKLLWHQSPALLAKLKAARPQEVGGAEGLSHPLLEKTLGAPVRYIWLRRRDKLAQAISYYRARHTGLWRSTDAAARRGAGLAESEPPFDFSEINRYLTIVNAFDQQWQFFALPVGHGDALAQVARLQPGADEEGFEIDALGGDISENAPGVGAVAAALSADLLDGVEERVRIVAGDLIAHRHQHRAALVFDFARQNRRLPVARRGEVHALGGLQTPRPGYGDGGDRAGGGQKMGRRQP